MEKFTAVVLAGGKGKRMNSSQPKALQELCGRPLIYYLMQELLNLKNSLSQIVIVVGYKAEAVKKEVKKYFGGKKRKLKIEFVYQPKLLGTAHALKVAAKKIRQNNVLVVCVDTPLITSRTLSNFVSFSLRKKLSCCLLTAGINEENSLGAVLRDRQGKLKAIEEKNSSASHPDTSEVNSGIYYFPRDILLRNLPAIKRNQRKKEYFLTDIIKILYTQGLKIETYFLDKSREILGINTQGDLAAAEKIMNKRLLSEYCRRGIRIIDFDTTFIQQGVKIGKNSIIYPFTFIEKGVIIGRNCSLGPFIHLRGASQIKANTHLGSFLEINRSKIGKAVKIKHFGYLGDTVVGDKANIGAGTVTANFDGKNKNKTYIQKEAFIGSDTILVAPVTIGNKAVTGAGSVITKSVKSNTVVVGVPAKFLKKKG